MTLQYTIDSYTATYNNNNNNSNIWLVLLLLLQQFKYVGVKYPSISRRRRRRNFIPRRLSDCNMFVAFSTKFVFLKTRKQQLQLLLHAQVSYGIYLYCENNTCMLLLTKPEQSTYHNTKYIILYDSKSIGTYVSSSFELRTQVSISG